VQDLRDFTRLTLEVAQCAQRVLSRHLLAPLIDEIRVVEWTRFDVRGFSSGLYLIFGQWFSDQCTGSFFDLDWRWRNATENYARVVHASVIGMNPRRDAEYWKIECTTAA